MKLVDLLHKYENCIMYVVMRTISKNMDMQVIVLLALYTHSITIWPVPVTPPGGHGTGREDQKTGCFLNDHL